MLVGILFRWKPEKSPFRNALLDLISYPSDGHGTCIISTGYIDSEIVWRDKDAEALARAIHQGYGEGGRVIFVSGSFKNNEHLSQGDRGLCSSNGQSLCQQHDAISYTAFGYKRSTLCWACEREHFFEHLKRQLGQLGSHADIQRRDVSNWHAKMAMKLVNGWPVATLIGSSNLTSPAFREWDPKGFAQSECDVLMCSPGYHNIIREARYDLGTLLKTSVDDAEATEFLRACTKQILDHEEIKKTDLSSLFADLIGR